MSKNLKYKPTKVPLFVNPLTCDARSYFVLSCICVAAFCLYNLNNLARLLFSIEFASVVLGVAQVQF